MMRPYFLLFLFIWFSRSVSAQGPDSLSVPPDTVRTVVIPPVIIDTTSAKLDSIRIADSLAQVKYLNDSIAKARAVPPPPPRKDPPKRDFQGKEIFFYVLVVLILFLGILKKLFPKYFADLFRIFFQRTLKQRQLYEQLVQTPLPSLLLNIFFLVVGGLYISFLLNYYNLEKVDNFWIQALYATGGLCAIYLGKYATLKFSGWLFQLTDPADDYSFIVFMINKMIGMFLLPCLVLIFLAGSSLAQFALYFSFVGLTLAWLYRIVLTFQLSRNRVKVNLFHFLLYIFGFEIIPLVLIYKLLLLVI
ncbi:MAG: DUF4271 domain-containing protein [Chitinophagales bacterium]|nr:DUF4271 domain-containing protein [Chitinophagales bacterium]